MKHFIVLLIILNSNFLLSQKLKIGSSYTFISETNSSDNSIKYFEKSLNINASYNIVKNHYLGMQYININTAGSSFGLSESKSNYFLAGIIYQYDLLKDSNSNLFPEISFNYGNYCTCGKKDPYKKESLFYFGYGFGYDFPVYKNIFIDTGFHFYQILSSNNQDFRPYAYTQYIVGLSLKI